MPNRPITFTFEGDLDKLVRALKDAGEDVEDLEKQIKDLPKATEKAADGAVKDFDRIGDEAKDRGRDAGTNFAQNLGEGLSSGNIGDTLQDTLGELVGEVSGPGSAAVAVGAAVALAVWNAFQAKSQTMKETVARTFDLFDEVTGQLDKVAQLEAAFTELGGGDFNTGLQDASKYASAIGISFEEIAGVITGEINPTTDITLQKLQQIVDTEDVATTAKLDQWNAAKEVLGTTELNRDALEQATINQQNWTTAVGDTVTKAEQYALILADTNMDGLVDSVELAKAGLKEVSDKAAEISNGKYEIRFDVKYGTTGSQRDIDLIIAGANPYRNRQQGQP